jgi:hypothetical protein
MTPQQFGAGQTRSTLASNNQQRSRHYSRPTNIVSNVQRQPAPLSVVVQHQYPIMINTASTSALQDTIPQFNNNVSVPLYQTREFPIVCLLFIVFDRHFTNVANVAETVRQTNFY